MSEVLCAHQNEAKINVSDQVNRIQYKYFTSERDMMPIPFTSIAELRASEDGDKVSIFNAFLDRFGSVDAADAFMRGLLVNLTTYYGR